MEERGEEKVGQEEWEGGKLVYFFALVTGTCDLWWQKRATFLGPGVAVPGMQDTRDSPFPERGWGQAQFSKVTDSWS